MADDRIAIILKRAEARCAERGERLTARRRAVLALILGAERPITAYGLLERLSAEGGRSVAPPIVYRALNFLLAQRLIHRIATLSAFVACVDADHPHHAQFVICDGCGCTAEICDPAVVRKLQRHGAALGYQVAQPIIELHGMCASCRAPGAAPARP